MAKNQPFVQLLVANCDHYEDVARRLQNKYPEDAPGILAQSGSGQHSAESHPRKVVGGFHRGILRGYGRTLFQREVVGLAAGTFRAHQPHDLAVSIRRSHHRGHIRPHQTSSLSRRRKDSWANPLVQCSASGRHRRRHRNRVSVRRRLEGPFHQNRHRHHPHRRHQTS